MGAVGMAAQPAHEIGTVFGFVQTGKAHGGSLDMGFWLEQEAVQLFICPVLVRAIFLQSCGIVEIRMM